MYCVGNFSKSPVFFSRSNTVVVKCSSQKHTYKYMPAVLPVFEIVFKSTPQQLWSRMTPVFTSKKAGFVTSPGFDVTRPYDLFPDAWCNITIPDHHVVMVSFPHFALRSRNVNPLLFGHHNFVRLSEVTLTGLVQKQHTFSQTEYISPRLYHSAMLTIRFKSEKSDWDVELRSGVNMSFSFHPQLSAPGLLTTGLFNCSVPHYTSFQQHLHCNLKQDCEGGEDEGAHCPFSSPHCKGWVEAGGKCYIPVDSHHTLSWQTARSQCKSRGADLAMMKTPVEWEAFWKISHIARNWKCAYVGLHLNSRSANPLYRKTWTWVDGSPAFDVNVTASSLYKNAMLHRNLTVIVEGLRFLSVSVDRRKHRCSRFLCQLEYKRTGKDGDHNAVGELRVNTSKAKAREFGLVHCRDGHLVPDFLSCASFTHCGANVAKSFCDMQVNESRWSLKSHDTKSDVILSIALFVCENKRTKLPYTLVCDLTTDCSDHSDENFCTHQICGEDGKKYRCTNGQCILFSDKCDSKIDCFDGSDEDSCFSNELLELVHFDLYTQWRL